MSGFLHRQRRSDRTDQSDGGAIQVHSVRDVEQQLDALKKENFGLKLRIYFLEENLKNRDQNQNQTGDPDLVQIQDQDPKPDQDQIQDQILVLLRDTQRQNVELKEEVERLRRERGEGPTARSEGVGVSEEKGAGLPVEAESRCRTDGESGSDQVGLSEEKGVGLPVEAESRCQTDGESGKLAVLVQAQARELVELRRRQEVGVGLCHVLSRLLADASPPWKGSSASPWNLNPSGGGASCCSCRGAEPRPGKSKTGSVVAMTTTRHSTPVWRTRSFLMA
ncbi:myomegalin [Salarias fasciatus]|uniref:myomegalin n=1 Tax=Salarias fasciatus TaxID=181472 RepID=UPI0011770819|nr:myomegalin-like [Salarias fasciatus]XP_029939802.1 myomegalin-like [Salarias fasciatus]